MQDLFTVYPELHQRISHLCAGVPWCMTGASALVYDDAGLYLEITKPKHWEQRANGEVIVGLGGIGGSIEPDEQVLACLYREVEEELHTSVQVESANQTYIVYEQQLTAPVALSPRNHPLPVLFTVSANLYRQERLPDCGVLAIATFWARLQGTPSLEDLYGLLFVPRDSLRAVLGPDTLMVSSLAAMEGVRAITREPLPARALLRPVWTGRSLQLLLRAGLL